MTDKDLAPIDQTNAALDRAEHLLNQPTFEDQRRVVQKSVDEGREQLDRFADAVTLSQQSLQAAVESYGLLRYVGGFVLASPDEKLRKPDMKAIIGRIGVLLTAAKSTSATLSAMHGLEVYDRQALHGALLRFQEAIQTATDTGDVQPLRELAAENGLLWQIASSFKPIGRPPGATDRSYHLALKAHALYFGGGKNRYTWSDVALRLYDDLKRARTRKPRDANIELLWTWFDEVKSPNWGSALQKIHERSCPERECTERRKKRQKRF